MANEVKIKGLDSLRRRLKKLGGDADKAMQEGIVESGLKIQKDAIKSIQTGSRTGIVYKRGSRSHTASAAGEAPKTDTGNLVANIRLKQKPKLVKVGVFGNRAIYGAWLELGTARTKGKKRPWLKPAFDKNRGFIKKTMVASLNRHIKKVAKNG